MIGNAQLDNEKAAAAYQVELYKDRYEELEEEHNQLQVIQDVVIVIVCAWSRLAIKLD